MIALLVREYLFNRLHYRSANWVFKNLSRIILMRSFFCWCAFSMKATNSLEGLGIRIVFVVSILIKGYIGSATKLLNLFSPPQIPAQLFATSLGLSPPPGAHGFCDNRLAHSPAGHPPLFAGAGCACPVRASPSPFAASPAVRPLRGRI